MTKQEYDDYIARVGAFFEAEGINSLSTVSDNALGEVEPYFSWTRCACCKTTLGGNRYDCVGYNPTTRLFQDGYSVCEDCVYFAEYGKLDDMTMLEVAQDEQRIWEEAQGIEAQIIRQFPKQYQRGIDDALRGLDYGHNNEEPHASEDAHKAYVLGWNYGREQKKGEDSYAK